uniref:Si:ch1073-416j23.1 n=1 Tax=Cynoglossus semilaevis TaxID=244447 RepID=A0A3P8UKP2_CYNSE
EGEDRERLCLLCFCRCPSEMLEVVRTFEAVRKRWLHAELELKKYKELLVKSDVAKAALEVKLKHARNQLDVEMKKRYKVEQRQMQLMCDILVHDSKSSACLNEEQKSLLATFEHRGGGNVTVQITLTLCVSRLSAIDESSFLSHSDISYDRTDDDLVQTGSTRSWLRSVTVIRPEMCQSCGKRIRFGKMAVKCRNCRTVAHPECKLKFTSGCSVATPTGSTAQDQVPQVCHLRMFAPVTHPRVPRLIADCVAEIERRGLDERGLYRVPGGERPVKELRERFLQGKTPLVLSKVSDIHVVCGLLKDFLRKLREPLITFRLHRTFMEASELPDEDNSSAVMFQAIAELPKANRDTLAFLMLHLHKVIRSPRCQMDQNNLARVFGPTIIGHGMSEPSPNTIMRDTNTQPKMRHQIMLIHGKNNQLPAGTVFVRLSDRLFQPLTSPEINSHQRSQNSGTVRGRIRNMGNAFTNT